MIIDLLSLPTYPQIYEKKSELLYYNDENLMFASLASNRRQTAFRLREYEVEAYHQQGENHAGYLLALASHFVEGIYRTLGLAADFGTDVPASEAVVLLAIHLPHLVNDMYRNS